MMQSKKCSRCKEVKPLDLFNKSKGHGIFGLTSHCKVCITAARKENKDFVNKRDRFYYQRHRAKKLAAKKRQYENNKLNNPNYVRESYLKRKTKIIKNNQDYYRRHKEKVDKRRLNRENEKRKKQLQDFINLITKFPIILTQLIKNYNLHCTNLKIKKRLRTRIWYVLKAQKARKSNKTEDLVGCDAEQLRNYLEKQFPPNVTWEHHGKGPGKFQIDHIKPCCSFDLTNSEEQKKCFHYSNLQILFDEDHKLKSSNDRKYSKKRLNLV